MVKFRMDKAVCLLGILLLAVLGCVSLETETVRWVNGLPAAAPGLRISRSGSSWARRHLLLGGRDSDSGGESQVSGLREGVDDAGEHQ